MAKSRSPSPELLKELTDRVEVLTHEKKRVEDLRDEQERRLGGTKDRLDLLTKQIEDAVQEEVKMKSLLSNPSDPTHTTTFPTKAKKAN